MNQEQNPQEFASRLVKFKALYQEALEKRYVINRSQFATLIGATIQTVSSAMNGSQKHMTEMLLIRAENAMNIRRAEDGIPTKEELPPIEEQQPTDTTSIDQDIEDKNLLAIIERICTCANTMCDTLNKERESHERIVITMLETLKK